MTEVRSWKTSVTLTWSGYRLCPEMTYYCRSARKIDINPVPMCCVWVLQYRQLEIKVLKCANLCAKCTKLSSHCSECVDNSHQYIIVQTAAEFSNACIRLERKTWTCETKGFHKSHWTMSTHIASFPVNDSHYMHAHSPSLTLEQMYRMYVFKQTGSTLWLAWLMLCTQYGKYTYSRR